MKKYLQIIAIVLTSSLWSNVFGQVVVDNTLTPLQLVEDVLLGQGVQVSNVTFSGDPLQIGYFDATNAVFPIEEGIVMTSGSVLDVPGPGIEFASSDLGGPADADMTTISGLNTNDAAILQFDFIPTGDSITFSFSFGSEEYPVFVNQFNDAFAFLISGPGFNGPYTNNSENIALIPGTTQPVTIDNVNDVIPSNAQYYVNNENGGANGVVYNGYTTSIQARAGVICGETYTLRFVIADALDSNYDSGVFLEASSLSSNALVFDIVTPSMDSTVVEGCTEAIVNIYSPTSDSTLAYDIIVSGNAIDGVDFTGIPDSIVIAAGDSVFSFVIEPLVDGVSENQVDTIIITIFTINSCGDVVANQGVVYIVESYEIEVEIEETPGPCADYQYSILTGVVSAGNPPFEYYWSTGDETPSIPVGFPQTTVVSLYVIDQCGIISDTAIITIAPGSAPPQPTVTVSNDVTLNCPTDQASLTAIGSNGTPAYSYNWSSGGSGSTINVSPQQTTNYVITVTDNCLLEVQDSILVTVNPYTPPSVSVSDSTIPCLGNSLNITAEVENGFEPFTYTWNNGDNGATINVTPAGDIDYIVIVEDECGNTTTDTASYVISIYDPLTVSLLNPDLIDGDTVTVCELWADTLVGFASGGLAPYSYAWSGILIESSMSNDSVFVNIPYELSPDSSIYAIHSVTVTDQCLNEVSVETVVEGISCDIIQPSIFNPNSEYLSTNNFCGNTPQNNVFNLPCLNLYPGNTMMIFDRWGRKCFETDDYHLNPWDGGNQSTGTYFYVCELPGGKDPVKGYFQLVR